MYAHNNIFVTHIMIEVRETMDGNIGNISWSLPSSVSCSQVRWNCIIITHIESGWNIRVCYEVGLLGKNWSKMLLNVLVKEVKVFFVRYFQERFGLTNLPMKRIILVKLSRITKTKGWSATKLSTMVRCRAVKIMADLRVV